MGPGRSDLSLGRFRARRRHARRLAKARPELAGWAILAFAFSKALLFDGSELGATPASMSLLATSGALLAAGFLTRWRKESGAVDLGTGSLAVAAVATVAAVRGIDRLLGHDQAFAAGLLGLAVLTAYAAAQPDVAARGRCGLAPSRPATGCLPCWCWSSPRPRSRATARART